MANEINSQKTNISVILPVYNVEKYLVKCLNSICNQNFSGTFEIIAVEACSTDNSLALLKSFQLNEPRLKIELMPKHTKTGVYMHTVPKCTIHSDVQDDGLNR
jgi:glycosyltransferase involved in cell wall biosynthesis